MSLYPQRMCETKELLAAGYVRVGTAGELYKPDGTALNPNGMQKAALVPNAVGANPTKAEFDALLTALKNAGLMSAT